MLALGSTHSSSGSTSLPSPTVADAQNWSSNVRDYSLRLERVAHNITSQRILYHLKLTLQEPIPKELFTFSNYLCLGWPLGGIWKITNRDEANRCITCVAWKQTELSVEETAELAKEYAPVSAVVSANQDRLPKTLFDWKMQLGTWKHANHWFVREVGLPPAYASKFEIPADTPLSVKLFAGLTPVEVSLVVNSIQALDTVTQRYTADVTWELTLRGITTIREDSVLCELLDLLEFNEEELEFSNLTDARSEKPLVTTLSQEDELVHYPDPIVVSQGVDKAPRVLEVTQQLHHLKYSRRLIAEFNEEMMLQSFPLDQQKLTFSFNMSKAIAPFIPIAPVSGEPGRFALENFKLGNVWKVVCGGKLFVGEVVDNGLNKMIRFEMLLERRSTYYLTNVAIPAAFITYLCFSSYAPLRDVNVGDAKGITLMDTDARLQIVLTLLLTAVTFKNQVASLIPQVSYFTTLDKYVFVCFIIACAVAVENALFPLIARWWGKTSTWREFRLLWFTVWMFTFINAVWGLYLYRWTCKRSERIEVLMDATEYVHGIANEIPNEHKEHMVRNFLASRKYKPELLPEFFKTKLGDIFVKLPSDSPAKVDPSATHDSGDVRDKVRGDIQKFRGVERASPTPSEVAVVVAKEDSSAAVVVSIRDARRGSRNFSSSYFAHGG